MSSRSLRGMSFVHKQPWELSVKDFSSFFLFCSFKKAASKIEAGDFEHEVQKLLGSISASVANTLRKVFQKCGEALQLKVTNLLTKTVNRALLCGEYPA